MALTIGRRWPKSAPRGDYQAMCDYCSVMWRRSQLRRDEAGLLVCPDEGDGLDQVALTRMNAQAALELTGPLSTNDGGHYFKGEGSAGDVHITDENLGDIEL